jgi:hypothetical protein
MLKTELVFHRGRVPWLHREDRHFEHAYLHALPRPLFIRFVQMRYRSRSGRTPANPAYLLDTLKHTNWWFANLLYPT